MVRNCSEMGENLKLIVERLMANDNLVNLLYYEDTNPLTQPHLTHEEKIANVFNNLICVVPRIHAREDGKSSVAIAVSSGSQLTDNSEFSSISIKINSYVPMNHWIINDTNLRPFLIMGEIEKSLKGKTVQGIGKLSYDGFVLQIVTDQASVYEQTFTLTTYD